MLRLVAILAEVELPGSANLDVPRQSGTPMQPAFIGIAALALAVVLFLVWDVWRQKRVERRERQRLERFREQRITQTAEGSALNEGPKRA